MKTLLILLFIGIVVYALYSCLDEIRDVLAKNKEDKEKEEVPTQDNESLDSVSIKKEQESPESKPISEMKVKEVVDIVMNSLYDVLSKKVVIFTESHKYIVNAVLTSLVSIIGLSSIVATNSFTESLIVVFLGFVLLFIASEKKSLESEKEKDVVFSVGSEED